MSGVPRGRGLPPPSSDVSFFVGEQHSSDTANKNIDEQFQKQMEKITLDIERIETEVLEMSSHFEDFYREDNGNALENEIEERAFGKLKNLIHTMSSNLHALGDENLGFKSDYPDREEALGLRVIEHQAVSLRFIEVIKELEVMHSKHRRVRKRKLVNMIMETGLIALKIDAKGFIEEGGDPAFIRELQLTEGVNAAESIRLRIEDHKKLEKRVDDLKKMIADTQEATEMQQSLIKEESMSIGEKEKEKESKFEMYFNYVKIFVLFLCLTFTAACVVVGLSMRIKPQWFGLPSTFSPGISEKEGGKVILQPFNAAEKVLVMNQRVVL